MKNIIKIRKIIEIKNIDQILIYLYKI